MGSFEDVPPIICSFLTGLCILSQLTKFKKSNWLMIIITAIPIGCVIFVTLELFIDNSSTGYLICRRNSITECVVPSLYKSQFSLNIFWQIIFNIILISCWMLFPIVLEFLFIGGNCILTRVKYSLLNTLNYFVSLFGMAAIWIMYNFITQWTFKFDLKLYAIVMNNTWGLIVIIIFMAYGAIEIPKNLWRQSNPVQYLSYLQIKTPKLMEELLQAGREYTKQVGIFLDMIDNLEPQHPCYSMVHHIHTTWEIFEGTTWSLPHAQNNHPHPITKKYVASMHRKIKFAALDKQRLQTQWNKHLKTTFFVQDIVNNLNNSEHRLTSSLKVLTGDQLDDFKLSISWWYNVFLYPILLKLLAICSLFLGIAILWSELTLLYRNPTLSVIAIIFEKIPTSYSLQNLVSLMFLSYMMTCIMYAMLSIKLFKKYYIMANDQNDLVSLLWVGSMMIKLALPLFANYLNLAQIGMFEKHPIVFNHSYGMFVDLVPFLGKNFNIYFPNLILISLLMVIFNLHTKLFQLLSMDDFFEVIDEIEDKKLEGKRILVTERSKRERQFQVDARRSPSPDILSESIEIEIDNLITPNSDDYSEEND